MLHLRISGFLLLYSVLAQPPVSEGWSLFAKVPFQSRLIKEYDQYFLVPRFDTAIRSKVGQEVQIKGHYMPFDLPAHSIIVSRYPYASCFFCGGAGPESVAEVLFKTKPPKLKADQVVTVKGKLRLNDTDVNHMNFILEDAVLITN